VPSLSHALVGIVLLPAYLYTSVDGRGPARRLLLLWRKLIWLCTLLLQEFNIEKLHLLEAEKAKIRKDFERRESQIEVKKKIEYSKQLNASRIKVRTWKSRTSSYPGQNNLL